MTIKPEKVWRVGDRVYPTYKDAVKYAASDRRHQLRQEVVQIIAGEFPEHHEIPAANLQKAVKDIFERFNVTRKRPKC